MTSSRVDQILLGLADQEGDMASRGETVCSACARAVPVTGVGLALMNDAGHQGIVAATNGPAKQMEELQFTLGEGPCIDSSREGRPVLQPDLVKSGPRRWPAFGPAVLEAGIRAIFAFPLQVGMIRLGVLDLYRDTPGILDNEQLEEALAFADAATTILMDLHSQVEAGESMNPQAYDVTDTGPEIHQATGMISAQAAVGLSEALLLLRAHAFSAERPIREVARDVVARLLRFHPAEDGSADDGSAEGGPGARAPAGDGNR